MRRPVSFLLTTGFLLLACISTNAQCMFVVPGYTFDCLSSTAQASVGFGSPAGTPPYTYTWLPGGQNTQTVNNLPMGSYTVTVKDANNCIAVGFLIIVNPYSPANLAMSSTMVTCPGGSNGAASVVFNNSNGPPFSYTWTSSSGPFSSSYSVSGLSAGIYSVSVKDVKGCGSSNTVQIKQPAPIVSVMTPTQIACFGTTVVPTFSTTGGTGHYSYSLNAVPVTSATTVGAGSYSLVVKDSLGCTAGFPLQVTQNNPNIITFSITPPSCIGKSDGAVVAQPNGPGAPPYTFTWQPVPFTSPQLNNIAAGTYTVMVGDNNSCVTRSVVIVNPLPPMQPTVLTHPENCSAQDGSYTVTMGGGTAPYSFTAFPGSLTGNTNVHLSSGTYTLVMEDAKSCLDTIQFVVSNLSTVQASLTAVHVPQCYGVCDGSFVVSVQNGQPPISYSVSGLPVSSSPVVNGLCTGTYFIKAVDAIGCPGVTQIVFPTLPVFEYSAASPPVVCIGQTVALHADVTGGTSPLTVVWEPGHITGPDVVVSPSVTTEYSLIVIDGSGCTRGAYKAVVPVNPPISISVPEAAAGVCPGATAQITPTITGGDGNYSYSWLPGSLTSSYVLIQSVNLPEYTLTVSDGCSTPPTTRVISLHVFTVAAPAMSFSLASGCAPLCVRLQNKTSGATNIVWNTGDQPQELAGDSVDYCYRTPGYYNVRIHARDSNGCLTTKIFPRVIHVLDPPVAAFVTDPATITLADADAVKLVNHSDGDAAFSWYVDDRFAGNARNITWSFPDTGCYHVKLRLNGLNGCRDSAEASVCVFETLTFYMPTAFTPNGDGLNDEIKPKGAAWMFDNYAFEIYTRWGVRVFRTTDPTKGWDGGYHESRDIPGKYLANANDVYYWKAKLTDNQGNEHRYEGHFMLVR